jgi:hypothetical protein
LICALSIPAAIAAEPSVACKDIVKKADEKCGVAAAMGEPDDDDYKECIRAAFSKVNLTEGEQYTFVINSDGNAEVRCIEK